MTNTIRFGIDTPDLVILDKIWGRNNQIWRNPHRILARSGEISPILAVFRRVSALPETDATRWQTDPRNPTLLTGRLRVENLLPDLLRVALRVGHKPDPPNPWTPLALVHYSLWRSYYVFTPKVLWPRSFLIFIVNKLKNFAVNNLFKLLELVTYWDSCTLVSHVL